MSHTTAIKTVAMTSLTAIQAMVTELLGEGLDVQLQRNAVPRMYYKDQIRKQVQPKEQAAIKAGKGEEQGFRFHANPDECDLVLKLGGSRYDVGFLRNNKGEYVPHFDPWEGDIAGVLGARSHVGLTEADAGAAPVGRMLQSYAKHAAIEAAEAEGFMVSSCETDKDGRVQLCIEVD